MISLILFFVVVVIGPAVVGGGAMWAGKCENTDRIISYAILVHLFIRAVEWLIKLGS